MSEAFHIISDGSCDLPVELTEEKNITVVPFYVSFDDEHYQKEIVEIGIRDFYQQMVDRKGVYPKSSMPSTQDYVDVFLPYVKQGLPVVCICITTKFSGSLQSAVNARSLVLEEHPGAQITVIDSTLDTVLQGLYVLEAVRLRDGGEASGGDQEHRKNFLYGGRYGIFKARRAHREGICRGGKRAGHPPGHHPEAGRNFPLRHWTRKKAYNGEGAEPVDRLSEKQREGR